MKLLRKFTKKTVPGEYGAEQESSTTSNRSNRADGANHKEQHLGLVLLYAAPPTLSETSGPSVDIVAIHGLGGDLRNTWTHKNGTLWLRDLLPQSIPGARIYTYGYPSKVFLNRSVAGIRDFSTHLLNALSLETRDNTKASGPRPIIYVCHSLGGVVFKQAMNLGSLKYGNEARA
ncbi:uncharacterized protein BDZ99DRAFT_128242 [Mytilinidion resinicola]|uniref:DUF676 domain-containing protein n=1 Tax=Mytilinidion resinicola TaxID=574789 RepID=A0A6A6Z706_9PEZI|nr:uncharacterized protein BDZ99DRAFT_128242 [Mytilinidion resinicola]KAF2816084.1 hypothetical protein BDZ99DRAFT_128242 [Mytilinidion resinicola]